MGLRKAFDFDQFLPERVRNPTKYRGRIVSLSSQAPVLIPRSELTSRQLSILSLLEGTDLTDDGFVSVDPIKLAARVRLLDGKLKQVEADLSGKRKKLGIYETTKNRLEAFKESGEFKRPITRPEPPEST